MVIEDYRKSLPGKSTRASFVGWLNIELDRFNLSLSLPLAIGIEKATGGVVSVRDWPGLKSGLRS